MPQEPSPIPPQSRPLLALLILLLLSACATQQQRTAGLLNHRLDARLAPDVAANRVAIQPRPDGATVTFLDASPSPGGLPVSDPDIGSVRAGFVEALLDPSLLRLSIIDTTTLSPDRKAERVSDLTRYLQSLQLGDTLQPTASDATPAGPPGVAVVVTVQCPDRREWPGYDSRKRKPGCF